MGRRRQGVADGMVDVVARMPWWAGVALAAASYLVLHRLAVAPGVPQAGAPGPAFILRAMVASLAIAGQYIVPVVCCVGALVSFVRRRQRAALFGQASGTDPAPAVAGMTWREFEMLVGEAYRRQGYAVKETGGGGADGGVDLVLRRGTEQLLVQCKHWRTASVGVGIVRELFGVVSARQATGGVIVTGGTFTPEARAFAAQVRLQLVGGPELRKLLQQAKAAAGAGAARPVVRQTSVAADNTVSPPRQEPEPAVPACPTCGSAMVHRTARKGPNAGAQFWGCTRYPVCRGTR